MAVDFTFLEVSFNSAVESLEAVSDRLAKYGFTIRTKHPRKPLYMCNQGRCIIFLRDTPSVGFAEISGIGLMCERDFIAQSGASLDTDTDMYYLTDPNGLRILLVTGDMFADEEVHYIMINTSAMETCGLKSFSGVRMTSLVVESVLLEFYAKLGFKITKRTENTVALVSSNNSFTLLIDKRDNQGITTIMSETDDIFRTTSCMVVRDVEFKELESKNKLGEELDYKVNGYGCAAYGNINSFSIENFAPDFIPGVDLILRMRKNYVHIKANTLESYYV